MTIERDAARVCSSNGFGLPLQHRLRHGQASFRFAQPSFGERPLRPILRLSSGNFLMLF